MSIAFVLGNGKSRLAVDLEKLRQFGKIYGCNALYRDFTPDVLVATDPEITLEIEASDYPKHNTFYSRSPDSAVGSLLIPAYSGFSSGPVALSLAQSNGHDRIFLIGFDLDSSDGVINNIYAGTECYRPKNSEPTYYGNWVDQIATIAKLDIIRVNSGHAIPGKWEDKVRECLLHDFIAAINNCKLEEI